MSTDTHDLLRGLSAFIVDRDNATLERELAPLMVSRDSAVHTICGITAGWAFLARRRVGDIGFVRIESFRDAADMSAGDLAMFNAHRMFVAVMNGDTETAWCLASAAVEAGSEPARALAVAAALRFVIAFDRAQGVAS